MSSQHEFIKKIRREKFHIGSEVSKEAKKGFESIKGDLDRAISQLSEDLYSKEIHFVLELIQNADDNSYNREESPILKFVIDENKILIQNNEKGFVEKNVEALCAVGKSTKSKQDGYIGEKGIGFKSVFRISDQPHIFSNGFHFKFKRKDEKYDLGYIIPYWIEEIPEYINKELTNIVLPLREDAKEHLSKFREIEPELLLFLRNLSLIEIHNKSENLIKKYSKSSQNGLVRIKSAEIEKCYKLISEKLKVPENIYEEKRIIDETTLILGFPIDKNGVAQTDAEQKIFAYLPTRSYGFRFMIQADFLVPTSREDIHKDKEWNKWLRDSITSVFLKAVKDFKKDDKLQNTFLNYVPLKTQIKDKFFSPVVGKLHSRLKETDCILTESSKWLKPAQVFKASSEIRSLISNDELQDFFGKEYISTDFEKDSNDKVLRALGVTDFKIDDLIKCLGNSDWLEKKSDEWFIELFSHLKSQSISKTTLPKIKKLKFIRLINKDLASPAEQRIFFPLSKKHGYGFENEIPFIKKGIISAKTQKLTEEIRELLKKLGILNPHPFEIIEEYILGDFKNKDENSNWQSKDTEILLGYVRYIKDNLLEYEKESDQKLNSRKHDWQEKDDPLKKLKEYLLIRTKRKDSKIYRKPIELYLSKGYKNTVNLESFFSGIKDSGDNQIDFVHEQYVRSSIEGHLSETPKSKEDKKKAKKKIADKTKEWRGFFIKLGVETKPRIEEETHERHHWTSGYNHYKRDATEYVSPIIVSILEQNDKDKNAKLLRILDSNWKYYKQHIKWRDYYFHYSWNSSQKQSDWYQKITNTNWVPAADGTLKTPSTLFLDKPEIRDVLGNSVDYLGTKINNKEFIEALSIKSEVNIETIIETLEGLIKENCTDIKKFNQFYSYLNDKFENNEATIKESFEESKLIFLPKPADKYVTSEKIMWEDVSNIFGDHRDYLEKHYPKLKSFFVDKLGISEKPVPKDYADLLVELSEKDFIDKKDEKNILVIYEELNSLLDPEENDSLISEEEWWEDFICEPIFWTNKSEFWNDDGDVFINDDDELYSLFCDEPEVFFIRIPNNYHPKLQYFLRETKVLYASKAVKTRLIRPSESTIEDKLKEKVQNLFFYIIRYLYKEENSIYEQLKKNNKLSQLNGLRIHGVLNLEVEYTLHNQIKVKDQIIYLNGNDLFVSIDYLENYGPISIELSKLFGNPKGLSDFINVLFLQKSEDEIEQALTDRKIQDLPKSEKLWLSKSGSSYKEESSVKASDEKTWTSFVEKEDKEPQIYEDDEVAENFQSEVQSTVVEEKEEVIEPPHNRPSRIEIVNENHQKHNNTIPDLDTSTEIHQFHENSDENYSASGSEWQPECEPDEAEIIISDPVLPKIKHLSVPNTEGHGTNVSEKHTNQNNSEAPVITAELNKETNKPVKDNLSQEAKMEIGKWGEKYAVEYLKKKYTEKYTDVQIEDTRAGFEVKLDKETLVTVDWLNKETDTGKGFDIKLTEKNNEVFIEVKSTKTDAKDIISLSGTQWRTAQEKQDNFYIYRIYNAGEKQNVRLEEFCNPVKLWIEGRINAQSISFKI